MDRFRLSTWRKEGKCKLWDSFSHQFLSFDIGGYIFIPTFPIKEAEQQLKEINKIFARIETPA